MKGQTRGPFISLTALPGKPPCVLCMPHLKILLKLTDRFEVGSVCISTNQVLWLPGHTEHYPVRCSDRAVLAFHLCSSGGRVQFARKQLQ